MKSRRDLNSQRFNHRSNFKAKNDNSNISLRQREQKHDKKNPGKGMSPLVVLATTGLIILVLTEPVAANSLRTSRKNKLDECPVDDFFERKSSLMTPVITRSSPAKKNNIRECAANDYFKVQSNLVSVDQAKPVNLSTRISSSSSVEALYRKNTNLSFGKDKVEVINCFNQLAKEKEMQCKIQLFLSEGGSIRLITLADVERGASPNEQAFYSQFTKVISIRVDKFKLKGRQDRLIDILRHELHHAYVAMLNYRNDQLVIDLDKKVSSAFLCVDDLVGDEPTFDCSEIQLIINRGLATARTILNLLNNPVDPEPHLISEYRKVCKDYEPKYPYLYTTNGMNDPRAPLLDLFHMTNRYRNDFLPLRVTEQDACAHQVLAQYPALFDFVFSGLREYHLNRNDEDFQRCMRPGK